MSARQHNRGPHPADKLLFSQDQWPVLWRIDRPVSNSGRLRAMLSDLAGQFGWNWEARLDDNPDHVLGSQYGLVVSADAMVLDQADHWANAARWIIDEQIPQAWIVPMSPPATATAWR